MASRAGLTLPLLLVLLAPSAPASGAERDLPAVARPRFALDGQTLGSGSVFFLSAPSTDAGAVGVAAAHSFDLSELARTDEVVFQLGRSQRRVSVSSRLHAEPGRPFAASGSSLVDDYLLFALDTKPDGARVLTLAPEGADLEGRRVRILGVPAAIPQDEDDIFGTVHSVSDTRIEVDLDVPVDLRGWGGAPVLRHPEGDVAGILEAAWPDANRLRLGVAPMDGVRRALAQPLEGGLGRPFAAWEGVEPEPLAREDPQAPPSADASGPPQPDPTLAPDTTLTARAEPPAPDPEAPGPPDADPEGDPSIEGPFALSARTAPVGPEEGETLLGRAGAVSTRIVLEVEHPDDGAIVGDENDAFVSGRALAMLGEFKRFDVVLVLDTSGSTNQMTGADINGNGVVGQGGLKGIFGQTDAGDSILAAEVAAARGILAGLDPRNTRVSLITFAGEPEPPPGTIVLGGGRRRSAALTEEPLTTDFARIESALEHVLERGPEGMTHMAQGLRSAIVELKGFRGGLSQPDPDSEKVVLFFTDGQPTLPYDPLFEADNVRAVLRAADLADRAGVRVHSFAIGPEALEGPVAVVEMARRTGGYFTPVRHPGDLVEVIENVSFANLDRLEVRNLTADALATELVTNADGSFGALVPLEVGRNRIQVLARASDGSEETTEVTLVYAPDAPRLDVPRELMAQRNRLLEQRLVNLRRGRISAEREAAEEARKELQLEIERERTEAEARAEQQRKQLDLEVLDDEAPAP